MTTTSPKKPSPLAHASPAASPRASPFRRQDSQRRESPLPASPSTIRAHSPLRASPASTRSNQISSAIWTSSLRSPTPQAALDMPQSRPQGSTSGDPLSKLHPAQLRAMRESFQTLDRNNDGQVGRDDVQDMLVQLGQDGSASSSAPFFSQGSGMNLSTYLNMLASQLAPLSRPDELLAAFSAFDTDDSGQIDLAELRDALLHTAPEPGERKLSERDINAVLGDFSGRRAFKRGMGTDATKRGDVFRYEEFVGSVSGGDAAKAEAGNPV